ncbi:uncharacterized protein LOC27206296 [Drosophila simulans]|uniref:Uncharacterized protein n=1 Tax=Drosophila simulans TaxID=7240 RepID=A0A0J9RV16_DROSI|nr:uncharacterized protein LOC27206296 [Drosophila simulans]KMY99611.1 uncharacterized protein Dsimw501_GD14499 [Drosophila simulans]
MNMRGMTTRSIWLECLRENAINMRLEHEDLGRRIAVSLASSQKALLDIDNLNQELTKMKDTIHNAISNVLGYENKCCELLLDILIKIVENNDLNAELNPNMISKTFLELDPICDKPEVVNDLSLVASDFNQQYPQDVPDSIDKNITEDQ